ncbi:MAG: ABC transporter substrate-binding protein [Lachnospiraceae bacterium]|nr:ABC transporter substrate-binding protein [Lachnospiraceae bacterium]
MKRKTVVAALLTALIIINVVACHANIDTNDDAKPTKHNDGETITVWAWDENFNIKALHLAAQMYNEINPNTTIEIVNMAQGDVIAALNTNLAAGIHEGLPNIVLIEDYRAPGYLNAFLHEFADLSGIASPSDFAEYKSAISSINGSFYSIPFDSGVAAMFYRLDLVEAAGFTEADMQNITWEEYIAIGITIKETTGVDLLTLNPNDLGFIRMMIQSAGAWYTGPGGEITIAGNQALKDAFDITGQLMEADVVRPISSWDQFVGAFHDGLVASVLTGCWIAPTISNANDQAGDWRIAAFPRMGANPDSVNASALGGSSWYVLQNVTGVEAALSFMEATFASNVDLMNALAIEINLVSTLIAAESVENYSLDFDFFGGQEILTLFAEWTNDIPAVDFGEHTYQIEEILITALQRFLNGRDIDTLFREYQTNAESTLQ